MTIKQIIALGIKNKFAVVLSMLAFALPLNNKLATLMSLLFFVVWMVDGAFKEKRENIKHHGWIVLGYLLFYLFYVGSMLYTSNEKAGWMDVQIKLSLGLMPILFASISSKLTHRKAIVFAFVWGSLLTGILCFSAAYMRYLSNHWPEELFYIRLAGTHHPSYLSLFVTLAVLILVFDIRKRILEKQPYYRWIGYVFLSLLFVFFILMLNSKAGILILFIVLLGVFGFFVLKGTKKWISVGLIAAVVVLFFSFLLFNGRTNAKINEIITAIRQNSSVYVNTAESSTNRLMAWKVSREIIAEHPMGVGIGDVKTHLLDKYQHHGLTIMYELKLNAHNQYLQTTIAIGLLGGAFLFLLLGASVLQVYKNGYPLAVFFMMIFILHMLVESMLERQAGVLFFAFFNAFFLFYPPQK